MSLPSSPCSVLPCRSLLCSVLPRPIQFGAMLFRLACSTRLSSARLGSAQVSVTRPSSARRDPNCLVAARPGPTRLCQAPLCPARLVSVRFGGSNKYKANRLVFRSRRRGRGWGDFPSSRRPDSSIATSARASSARAVPSSRRPRTVQTYLLFCHSRRQARLILEAEKAPS